MLIWACAAIGRETTLHDTERAAADRATWLLESKTATKAVCYPLVVEPPIRLGYWERRREAA